MARKNSTKAVAGARTARSGDSRSAAPAASPPGIASAMVDEGEPDRHHRAVEEQRQVVDQTTDQSKVMTSRDAPRAGRPRRRRAPPDSRAGNRRASPPCRARTAGRSCRPRSAICRSSSGTAITEAMALSLMAMTSSEPSAGSMRIRACGRMMVRIACGRLIPSASAARIWPRPHRGEPGADGLRDIGAEMEAERDHCRPSRRRASGRSAAGRRKSPRRARRAAGWPASSRRRSRARRRAAGRHRSCRRPPRRPAAVRARRRAG